MLIGLFVTGDYFCVRKAVFTADGGALGLVGVRRLAEIEEQNSYQTNQKFKRKQHEEGVSTRGSEGTDSGHDWNQPLYDVNSLLVITLK